MIHVCVIFCRRLADSDITVTPSVSAWTDYSGDIIMQLIQFPLQHHRLFLMKWGRNVNLHHLVQSKWNWWKTAGTEEKLDTIRWLKKGDQNVTYVGYPESKFRWAIKKKQEYITNHAYCHLMYILYNNFLHSFHHSSGTCHSAAPVFIVEWCRLLCKARGNGFFDLTVVLEPPASKEGFKMQ